MNWIWARRVVVATQDDSLLLEMDSLLFVRQGGPLPGAPARRPAARFRSPCTEKPMSAAKSQDQHRKA
jgi:hypothetical protein